MPCELLPMGDLQAGGAADLDYDTTDSLDLSACGARAPVAMKMMDQHLFSTYLGWEKSKF